MKRVILTFVLTIATLSCASQTREEVLQEIRRQCIPHARIVLAQARLETGNFTSGRCKRDHNLFGIKHNGRYAKYRTWQDSIKDYKQRISSRYDGGCYYAFLKRIKYAEDKKYINKLKQF